MNLSQVSRHDFQRAPGYIYAVRGAGLVKIGKSATPAARLAALRTSSPTELEVVGIYQTDDMDWLEKNLHIAFSDERVRGEWFDIGADDFERAMNHLAPLSERFELLTKEQRELRREQVLQLDYCFKSIYWRNWRDTARARRACAVCGVPDERRNMIDLEEYEAFIVCQRCAGDLTDD